MERLGYPCRTDPSTTQRVKESARHHPSPLSPQPSSGSSVRREEPTRSWVVGATLQGSSGTSALQSVASFVRRARPRAPSAAGSRAESTLALLAVPLPPRRHAPTVHKLPTRESPPFLCWDWTFAAPRPRPNWGLCLSGGAGAGPRAEGMAGGGVLARGTDDGSGPGGLDPATRDSRLGLGLAVGACKEACHRSVQTRAVATSPAIANRVGSDPASPFPAVAPVTVAHLAPWLEGGNRGRGRRLRGLHQGKTGSCRLLLWDQGRTPRSSGSRVSACSGTRFCTGPVPVSPVAPVASWKPGGEG